MLYRVEETSTLVCGGSGSFVSPTMGDPCSYHGTGSCVSVTMSDLCSFDGTRSCGHG